MAIARSRTGTIVYIEPDDEPYYLGNETVITKSLEFIGKSKTGTTMRFNTIFTAATNNEQSALTFRLLTLTGVMYLGDTSLTLRVR